MSQIEVFNITTVNINLLNASHPAGQRPSAQTDVISGHHLREEHEEVGRLHHQDRSASAQQRRGQQGFNFIFYDNCYKKLDRLVSKNYI